MGIDPPSSVVEEEATEAVGECCWTWRTRPRKPFGSWNDKKRTLLGFFFDICRLFCTCVVSESHVIIIVSSRKKFFSGSFIFFLGEESRKIICSWCQLPADAAESCFLLLLLRGGPLSPSGSAAASVSWHCRTGTYQIDKSIIIIIINVYLGENPLRHLVWAGEGKNWRFIHPGMMMIEEEFDAATFLWLIFCAKSMGKEACDESTFWKCFSFYWESESHA